MESEGDQNFNDIDPTLFNFNRSISINSNESQISNPSLTGELQDQQNTSAGQNTSFVIDSHGDIELESDVDANDNLNGLDEDSDGSEFIPEDDNIKTKDWYLAHYSSKLLKSIMQSYMMLDGDYEDGFAHFRMNYPEEAKDKSVEEIDKCFECLIDSLRTTTFDKNTVDMIGEMLKQSNDERLLEDIETVLERVPRLLEIDIIYIYYINFGSNNQSGYVYSMAEKEILMNAALNRSGFLVDAVNELQDQGYFKSKTSGPITCLYSRLLRSLEAKTFSNNEIEFVKKLLTNVPVNQVLEIVRKCNPPVTLNTLDILYLYYIEIQEHSIPQTFWNVRDKAMVLHHLLKRKGSIEEATNDMKKNVLQGRTNSAIQHTYSTLLGIYGEQLYTDDQIKLVEEILKNSNEDTLLQDIKSNADKFSELTLLDVVYVYYLKVKKVSFKKSEYSEFEKVLILNQLFQRKKDRTKVIAELLKTHLFGRTPKGIYELYNYTIAELKKKKYTTEQITSVDTNFQDATPSTIFDYLINERRPFHSSLNSIDVIYIYYVKILKVSSHKSHYSKEEKEVMMSRILGRHYSTSVKEVFTDLSQNDFWGRTDSGLASTYGDMNLECKKREYNKEQIDLVDSLFRDVSNANLVQNIKAKMNQLSPLSVLDVLYIHYVKLVKLEEREELVLQKILSRDGNIDDEVLKLRQNYFYEWDKSFVHTIYNNAIAKCENKNYTEEDKKKVNHLLRDTDDKSILLKIKSNINQFSNLNTLEILYIHYVINQEKLTREHLVSADINFILFEIFSSSKTVKDKITELKTKYYNHKTESSLKKSYDKTIYQLNRKTYKDEEVVFVTTTFGNTKKQNLMHELDSAALPEGLNALDVIFLYFKKVTKTKAPVEERFSEEQKLAILHHLIGKKNLRNKSVLAKAVSQIKKKCPIDAKDNTVLNMFGKTIEKLSSITYTEQQVQWIKLNFNNTKFDDLLKEINEKIKQSPNLSKLDICFVYHTEIIKSVTIKQDRKKVSLTSAPSLEKDRKKVSYFSAFSLNRSRLATKQSNKVPLTNTAVVENNTISAEESEIEKDSDYEPERTSRRLKKRKIANT
ncbi:uncharacterized protein KGF55_000442 [Candida pseudojiufengensis]|uniref:uncharacterized protein n=1 Tax=Candida pseudojiufengensis TaxID=497109 RepID=UPI00222548ED|nr:uncharacterized protein KGF55_000442 [Candida pseudojiufengensis]KAI5967032.1 hypothetical protein KGF55_000442 [Candida pseudojiufengensis]